jgi:hypothetical protein
MATAQNRIIALWVEALALSWISASIYKQNDRN